MFEIFADNNVNFHLLSPCYVPDTVLKPSMNYFIYSAHVFNEILFSFLRKHAQVKLSSFP